MSERRSSEEITERLRANSRIFLAALITAVAATAFAWSVFGGPEHGLPVDGQLIRSSGRLISHKWGYRSGTIRLLIDTDPREFIYSEKMGEKSEIWANLCDGCVTDIWSYAEDRSSSPFAFQIAVNGRIIRSYRDVKATWLADNARSPIFMIAFGFISSALVGYGLFQRQRLKKVSH